MQFIKNHFLFLTLLLQIVSIHSYAIAQNSPLLKQLKTQNEETIAVSEADVAKKRDELRKQLLELKAQSSTAAAEQSAEFAEKIQVEQTRLKEIELILEQQQTALTRRTTLEKQLEVVSKIDPNLEITTNKKKSFLELEHLRGKLGIEEIKVERAKRGVVRGQEALVSAQSLLDELQRKRRKIKEEYGEKPTPAQSEKLKLLSFEVSRAEQDLILKRLLLKNSKIESELSKVRLELLKNKLAALSKIAKFDESVVQEALEEISIRESRAKKTKDQLLTSLHKMNRRWLSAKQTSAKANGVGLESKVEEEVSFRMRETIEVRIDVIDRVISILAAQQEMWRQRLEFHAGSLQATKRKNILSSSKETKQEVLEELKIDQLRLSELRNEFLAIESRFNESGEVKPSVTAKLSEYKKNIDATRDIYEQYIEETERLRRLNQSLEAELSEGLSEISFGQQFAKMWGSVVALWNFEITSIDERPITIKKLVLALFLFAIGYFLSRTLSRQLRRKLLPRLRLTEGVAAALESLSFYVLVLIFALFALKVVHIPLTIFTLLGGAIAIGVGFGSQNLINNFISGLILLLEQPIRVGDLIEVDSLTGKVDRIGLRSTMIRTGDNIDVLVPNSSFLQKNVVNWTLADDRVRLHVLVGVNYGSPTDKVTELLLRSVTENEKVHSSPTPQVWFKDFGDNALIFEVLFWARIKSTTEKFTLQSEVRYAIDALFREAGLVIAFPQRDVHLDSVRPIQIKMV